MSRRASASLDDSGVAVHRRRGSSAARGTPRASIQLDGQDAGPVRSPDQDLHGSPPQSTAHHQRFALADPVAFRYLAEDRSTTVLERKRELQGYQCYVIEQWACSRRDPTFVITAYTGNPSHIIKVGVLSVPANEDAWSPELKMYFKALTKLHARRRDTAAGSLMVTNLSGFPSSLTLVHVPDGDIQVHREMFFVNEDLKRLACTGRAGLTLSEPSVPTRAKFYQLYKVSEKIPFYSSVVELVKLCQAALMLYGQLGPEYADGLLCDVTERAVNDWWADIGAQLYSVEPNDGILGPTTVAALLGTLMGARNRLSALGAPIAKDVFELEMTKKAIGSFQKAQRITPRTRRLDRQTLDRLHKVTARQATSEGWTVPRAVKSTMAELSGKGGEMVMDIVGRGDRISIADVETVDYDRFVQLVKGERARWLWHGKARRRTTRDVFSEKIGPEVAAFRDDQDTELNDVPPSRRESMINLISPRKQPPKPRATSDADETRPSQMKKGSVDDTDDGGTHNRRSGVFDKARGRIKDAVNKRGHGHGHHVSKDMGVYKEYNRSADSLSSVGSDGMAGSPSEHPNRNRLSGFLDRSRDDGKHRSGDLARNAPDFAKEITETPTSATFPSTSLSSKRASVEPDFGRGMPFEFGEEILPAVSMTRSLVESYLPCAELHTADLDRVDGDIGLLLRRSHSFSQYESLSLDCRPHDSRWPRHLSFSTVEASIPRLSHQHERIESTENVYPTPKRDLFKELARAADLCRVRFDISDLDNTVMRWVQGNIKEVSTLHLIATEDIDQLKTLINPRREDYTALQEVTRALVGQERHQLQEDVNDIETMRAKLEYELNSLQSKVEDVERAVADFERQVTFTEGRVDELTRKSRQEGWVTWVYGLFLRSTMGSLSKRE